VDELDVVAGGAEVEVFVVDEVDVVVVVVAEAASGSARRITPTMNIASRMNPRKIVGRVYMMCRVCGRRRAAPIIACVETGGRLDAWARVVDLVPCSASTSHRCDAADFRSCL